MAFFGFYGSTAALATTLALSAVASCTGIGFQRGTHTRWQLVTNDASGAPTLVDMGASFAIATGGVLTLFISAAPNAGSVWVRVVDEVTGAVFEQEVMTDVPAATQFLAPRLYMNNGATAAAVAFDCAGVYVETDYEPDPWRALRPRAAEARGRFRSSKESVLDGVTARRRRSASCAACDRESPLCQEACVNMRKCASARRI